MKKNIVISNIYGKYNLGDQSIRNSALKMLSEIYGDCNFDLLCESINNFTIKIPNNISAELHYSPYGYAIDNEKRPNSLTKKFFLLTSILIVSSLLVISGKIVPQVLPAKGFFSYITLIRNAHVVILMGGGYLVTKHRIKDFFGVLLNAAPLFIAKSFGKKIVILPISFGPFASKYHEMILGEAISNTHLYCRDRISLSFAKRYNNKAIYMPDLALYEWRNYAAQ